MRNLVQRIVVIRRFIVECAGNLSGGMTPTPLDGVERDVPDDLQQPRPRILATESFERSESPHERILHHVLGRGGILHQPTREAVRRREMWKDVPVECRARPAFTARQGGHAMERAWHFCTLSHPLV